MITARAAIESEELQRLRNGGMFFAVRAALGVERALEVLDRRVVISELHQRGSELEVHLTDELVGLPRRRIDNRDTLLELARAYVVAKRVPEARALLVRAKRVGSRSKYSAEIDGELAKLRAGAADR